MISFIDEEYIDCQDNVTKDMHSPAEKKRLETMINLKSRPKPKANKNIVYDKNKKSRSTDEQKNDKIMTTQRR